MGSFECHLTGMDEVVQGPLRKGHLSGKSNHKMKTADFKTHGIQDWDSYVWVLRKYVNFIQCCKEIQAGAPAPCLPPPLLRPKSFGDKGISYP